MPTATQEIAALKRAVKQLEDRLDALERDKLEQVVREGFAENGALINLLLKQRTDDRTLADQRYDALIARIDKNQAIAGQRHTQIMAQLAFWLKTLTCSLHRSSFSTPARARRSYSNCSTLRTS
jgi:hypothetical protein